MVINLLNFIGDEIKDRNTYFDKYTAIAFQQEKDGKVYKFTTSEEREYCGLSDADGIAFYVKVNPIVTFQKGRQLTATKQLSTGTIECSLIAYQVANSDINTINWQAKLTEALNSINFNTFVGAEKHVRIEVKSTNNNAEQIFKDETGKEIESDLKIVAISYNVIFSTSSFNCDECNIFESEGGNCTPSAAETCAQNVARINALPPGVRACVVAALEECPACEPGTVENSNATYSQEVASGGTLDIPDVAISNSDDTYQANAPSAVPFELPDVTHTDSDGTPVAYPGQKAFTCTPQVKDAAIRYVFGIGATADQQYTILSDEAGTFTAQTLVNVSSVTYYKNGVADPLPFTLAAGDVLRMVPVITNTALDASVRVTGTYV